MSPGSMPAARWPAPAPPRPAAGRSRRRRSAMPCPRPARRLVTVARSPCPSSCPPLALRSHLAVALPSRPPQQLVHREPERTGDGRLVAQRRVGHALLNAAQRRARDAGSPSQVPLRHPLTGPLAADLGTERAADLGHDANRRPLDLQWILVVAHPLPTV